jgi:glutathione S-transferase
MSHSLYINETPEEVKNAKVACLSSLAAREADILPKGLHLITQSTPNGQKLQIMLEELADAYGTTWTMTKMYVD